ncbi:hypothetical protein RFI_16075 [Reticulomyxa filosa]|uniref:WH1 domain-containing protein n=1 Tax=Reticulomyxa filosa TaxID=46433 RepID=X6N4B6_RETFI|nr:hypothetical protein RFI_16075 [Reticulomyxa filosa]|eukprot:ETO21130.1 hypothetical protein RFI_16075 [Reticulomyxa filosa]
MGAKKNLKKKIITICILEQKSHQTLNKQNKTNKKVHLCCDSSDNTYRLLAWTVKSQQVLLNANCTAECMYKEKSQNFHSFTDENGQRYGLGFHKSDSGLKQAEHQTNKKKKKKKQFQMSNNIITKKKNSFLAAVADVIEKYKKEVEEKKKKKFFFF